MTFNHRSMNGKTFGIHYLIIVIIEIIMLFVIIYIIAIIVSIGVVFEGTY